MKNWLLTLPSRLRWYGFPRRSVCTEAARRRLRTRRPELEHLEDRLAPAFTALGAGPLGQPLVTILDEAGTPLHSFLAYDAGFGGGVNVALGDTTGDGIADIITGAGSSGGPHVKVFDGVTFAEIHSFFAYDPAFAGGVQVATADVDANGVADIVTGAGPGGGPHVKVFDGGTLAVVRSFFAYDSNFTGGVNVAAGDLNGDLLPDLFTGAGPGGGPHVRAFDVATGSAVSSFFAYDISFTGGVNVASGDVDGNGTVELLTGAGPGGGPHVRAWAAGQTPTVFGEFMALDGITSGGVRIGSIPGSGGAPDRVAATSQTEAGPVVVSDMTGQVVGSQSLATGAALGVSISSPVSQPDLLLRYHTLSQVAPEGGAGRLELVGAGQIRLTLNGLQPDSLVQFFADAPGRGTGQDTVADFVNRIWPRQYGAQGANAVVETLVGNRLFGTLLHLTNPQLDFATGTLTFDATPLEDSAVPEGPQDADRLIVGLSPSDVTNVGAPLPVQNHGSVQNFAIAAVGGVLAANGNTGTLTLETPLEPTGQFGGVPNQATVDELVGEFVSLFGERFGSVTPNAAVIYQDEQGAMRTVTLNLATARSEGNNAVFDVAFTGVPRGGRLTLPLLFVDQSTPGFQNQNTTCVVSSNPLEMPCAWNPSGDPNQVMFSDATLVSLNKSITLINSSDKTVYPFLRGSNDGRQNPGNPATGYDLKDAHNEEYRGYIGYQENGKNLFGLKKGEKITFRVPLALWDSARIAIATDSKFLKNNLTVGAVLTNNPYQYYEFQYVDPQNKSKGTTRTLRRFENAVGNGGTGLVMWYHANFPSIPSTDAAEQLIEFTIRDPYQYTLNPGLPNPSPTNYLGPLFNYDVSYVDHLMLPVAMQAINTPFGPYSPDNKPPPDRAPYGWAGTVLKAEHLQPELRKFATDNPANTAAGNPGVNGLGQYFDGRGWGKFYIPSDATTGVKIPSGARVFQDTPYGDHLSTYAPATNYIMASGGIEYRVGTNSIGRVAKGARRISGFDGATLGKLAVGMQAINLGSFKAGTTITKVGDIKKGETWIDLSEPLSNDWPGGQFTFVGSTLQHLSGEILAANKQKLKLDNRANFTSLKVGMLLTSSRPDNLEPGTRILSIPTDPKDLTITLDKPAKIAGRFNYTFSGGVSDYVAERLMALWFGWADYYVDTAKTRNAFVGDIPGGSVINGGRTLRITGNANVQRLIAGQTVSGSNIRPGTIITSFGPDPDHPDDKTYINLSQLAMPAPSNPKYTFGLPQKIADRLGGVSNLVPKFELKFDASAKAKSDRFAQTVYTLMASLTGRPIASTDPVAIGFMINVIGYVAPVGPEYNDDIRGELRDKVKSVMRGVYDFVKENESTGLWYPAPHLETPGATINGRKAWFNVYNMNPYVWFVHSKLNISAYAFSVDDDAADVAARGATTMNAAVGGLPLPNGTTAEWTIGAPFGPVSGAGKVLRGSGNNPDRIIGLPYDVWWKLNDPDLKAGALGALVAGVGVQPGTRVTHILNDHNGFSVELDMKLLPNQNGTFFSFFGHVHATGTINPATASKIISGLDAQVMAALKQITNNGALVPGALVVRGPGLAKDSRVTKVNFTNNSVELESSLDAKLAGAGTYVNGYTFA